jgi:hypothetical protein
VWGIRHLWCGFGHVGGVNRIVGWSVGRGSRPGVSAWLPSIPEFGEVLEAWEQGVKGCLIREWLRVECGYGAEASVTRVETWLRNHHPRG